MNKGQRTLSPRLGWSLLTCLVLLSPFSHPASARPAGRETQVPGGTEALAMPSEAAAPANASSDGASAEAVDEVSPQPVSALSATVTVKVTVQEQAADAMVAAVESLGGYFATRQNSRLTLKIPVTHARSFLDSLDICGLVVARTFQARNVGLELTQLRAQLKGRQTLLKDYFALLESAGPKAVFSVEKEIALLISEIEGLQGKLRKLEHELEYATVEVEFQFRDRSAPAPTGASSFEWLNTMNLTDLVQDFRSAR